MAPLDAAASRVQQVLGALLDALPPAVQAGVNTLRLSGVHPGQVYSAGSFVFNGATQYASTFDFGAAGQAVTAANSTMTDRLSVALPWLLQKVGPLNLQQGCSLGTDISSTYHVANPPDLTRHAHFRYLLVNQ